MFEKIVSILKEFLEKHFMPSLFSIIVAAGVYYITPNDMHVVTKLGKSFYIIVIFCISLFLSECFMALYRKVSNNIYYSKQKKEYDRQTEIDLENRLYEISHMLTPDNRKILDYFLDNGNKPLILNGYIIGNQFLEYYCDHNEFIVDNDHTIPFNPMTLKPEKKLAKGKHAEQYRLRDEYYEGFMYLKQKYGKITKF